MINTSSLPTCLQTGVELRWQRLKETADKEEQEILASRTELPMVWASSDFVADYCIRQPSSARALITDGLFDHPSSKEMLQHELLQKVASCEDEAQLDRCIRQFRQQEMTAIAWRDLSGTSTLEQTMESVSQLAEICISVALEKHLQWMQLKHGTPRGNPRGDDVSVMVVIALGKLGGGELNFSSDVDLVFAYSKAGSSDGEKTLDNQTYFTRLGQKVIKTLDTRTADGFVFRTDMRLRPNGDSGPLVLSFAAIEDYYQTHGRSWERYAWIKARIVGGNRQIGQQLLEALQPFVYRKYLDFGAFEAIRSMKALITNQLRSKDMQQNIKLGKGGIREIEFWVQSHQLIRGGREKALQTPRLYDALDALESLGLIDRQKHNDLLEAYRFLRNSEHRLQMIADEQTQTLPDDKDKQLRLAWSMGCSDWSDFTSCLQLHMSFVHQMFSEVMEPESVDQGDDARRMHETVWQAATDHEQMVAYLAGGGYENPDNVIRLLKQFREGKLLRAYSSIERDRLDKLMPIALVEAGKLAHPERALTQFVAILESIGKRSAYLILLIENPVALQQLLKLCAASSWISRWIGRHPVVMDELLQPVSALSNIDHAMFADELDRRLAQCESGDLEAEMNQLREFHHAQVLQVAAADVIAVIDSDQVFAGLTTLAEVILSASFKLAERYVNARIGERRCDAGIIAYGKLGGYELGYHSDLDIVLCYEKSRQSGDEYYYSRLGQRLVHLLTTRTAAGLAYEIDMRLRPSGRSGTLVTSLDGFRKYQLQEAWTWEHQALIRARAVVGNQQFRDGFERMRAEILCQQRDIEQLRHDVAKMRKKMIDANCQSDDRTYDIKLDRGGLVEIEFIVQYLVLCYAAENRSITEPRSVTDCLQTLSSANFIDSQTAVDLSNAYKSYLKTSLKLKLNDQPMLIGQHEYTQVRQQVIAVWDKLIGDL